MIKNFILAVERAGNRLPHPTLLFVWLCVAVLALSALLSALGWNAIHPSSGANYEVTNLLNIEGINRILGEAVTNFTSFAPVGVVLVMMLGIGIAEHSGLIQQVLKRLVRITKPALLAYVVAFAGVMSSLGADVGYVVLIPIAGLIYHSQNRPPLAGIAVAFASVSAGFSANLFIGPVDIILSGLSTEAAHLVDPTASVAASDNYYFIVVSTLIITVCCGLLSNRIVEPHLANNLTNNLANNMAPTSTDERTQDLVDATSSQHNLKPVAIFSLLFIAGLIGLSYSQSGSDVAELSLQKHIVPLLALFFALAGYVHGRWNGVYNNASAAIEGMEDAMRSMAYYIVLMFFAAQFVSYFSWSQIGIISAIKGAEFLGSLNATPTVLLPLFILLTASINLVLGSASAKWALLAPVFVPMLMLLGIPPEQTQVAYRVGDSITNIITPLMPYFGIVLAYAQRYQPDLGVGDIVGMMLPYSLTLLIVWGALTSIWIGFAIPLGP